MKRVPVVRFAARSGVKRLAMRLATLHQFQRSKAATLSTSHTSRTRRKHAITLYVDLRYQEVRVRVYVHVQVYVCLYVCGATLRNPATVKSKRHATTVG